MRCRHFLFVLLFLPAACVSTPEPPIVQQEPEQAEPSTLDGHIAHFAAFYDVPESLVHRVVKRESTYNPKARNGPYYGLMQILPETARTMGFRGKPSDLLDAKTNLRYGVKYLRGAWLLSNGSHDQAVKWYSRGYYYEAKRRGMLVETGLRPG
jgi:soluble lytic murein transglycosylase-like protein